jgi:hypothetical protein
VRAQITVLTIGVDALKKSLKFYRDGLSLKTEGISECCGVEVVIRSQ